MSSDALALVDAAWREGLTPEPQITVSAWADRHRMLPAESAEPGRWRTARTPYLRGVMDALSTGSPFERVIFMKGAQLGGTEAGLNWIAYIIANAPGLALLVMPSLDMVRRNTRTRIDPMIETTPELRQRIAPPRARDSSNTAFAKAFPGGMLVMTGANSAAGLRSTPARYLFLDEVDGYPTDAEGEGDPVDLAVKRTATYRGKRRILMVSTPTLKGASRIEAAFAESDQRRFFLPCPHCEERFALMWEHIRWPQGRRSEAYVACPACGAEIVDRDKPRMLAAGEWRATAPGDGRTAGFHLSSLYSPFETWGELAARHGSVRRDPARLKVFVNTVLAETWEDHGGEKLDADGLMGRRESWGELLPDGVAVVTAGVDVQGDRIEAQFVGWGADEEAWVLDYRVIWGDPSGPNVWNDLDALLLRGFRHRRALPDLPVMAACVDTGGRHTAASYDFVRARLARRVWGIKGASRPDWPPWPRRLTKGKGGAPIAVIGVDALKDKLAARLSVAAPGPGYLHFAAELDAAYFAQLTAEKVVTKYAMGRPKRQWTPREPGARNEALDTLVYASAALAGLATAGYRLDEAAARVVAAPDRAEPGANPEQPRPRPVIRSRWLDR